jgi:L-aspartate semialdehyde sulfurtransferase
MKKYRITKTLQEINAKIRSGEAVVVTAEEIIAIVKTEGPTEAARRVDVVTTGTFAPMCSSGAFINFGHSTPPIKASRVWLNRVPAYAGLAAVDCYIGATEPAEDDPLNKVYPGEFNYGGGHVIQDLVDGKPVQLVADGYGTDCYPNRRVEKEVTLRTLPQATLCNPRNGYQNYNCAVNLSHRTVYTYMGTLKPGAGNANYCSAGQLSPLFNDPYYQTIGLGTRIFLGGGVGYVTWHGTQHHPGVKRTSKGVPVRAAGTLWVGLGVPIPLLNEEIAAFTGISDEEIFTQIIDYGHDYPRGEAKSLGQVSYAELKSGMIRFRGKEVPTVPLSSMVKAREIAEALKIWIREGRFLLSEPQFTLPTA